MKARDPRARRTKNLPAVLLVAVFGLGLQSLPACQVAFGGFTIDTSKLAVSCEPNVARCDAGRVETCVNGNEWKVSLDCHSADLCNLATRSCMPCQPGSYQCSDAQPQVCGADRKWVAATSAPCASAALCNVPDDGSRVNCEPPGCPVAGQLRCLADHLQRCPFTQKAWVDLEICASAELCDAGAASLRVAQGGFATCEAPACGVGEFNCEAGSPAPCKADRTGWDAPTMSCPTGSPCNVDKGDCSACVAETFVCSGAQLAHCTQQHVWSTVSCASASLCNASGPTPGCTSPICAPGAFQCDVQTSALERCRSDGSAWEFVEQCLNAALCTPLETRCEVPKCATAGALRCNGAKQERCRADLTGWDAVATCLDSGTCDPQRGCVAVCTEGAYRCNDVALEKCVSQLWVRQAACATAQLCDENSQGCIAPSCSSGERRCFGAVLKRCNSALNAWDELQTCGNNQICNPSTASCEQR